MQLASLSELKAHLNLPPDSSEDNAELGLVLGAAQDVVTGLVGSFSDLPVTETVSVVGGVALLSGRPAGSVTSGGLVLSGVNARAGIVKGLGPYLDSLTVTYSTGTGFPPYAVKLAALIIAANLYETQRGSQPLPIQGNPDDQSVGTSSYAPGIPTRARVLLEPFVRRFQIA